ncbi:carbohydrate-binding module family 21 protein [Staphylotrichum tortipilum]|uniref:Carbohydrate-binding module family 21 protein n=1 Tax=Staphylotrichum tortipilum TaxID=2831512 RepID=A0AAN6RRH5_9PEZI|nr:carbohydrate-binding module family 21 protein [Staphylotrichum longicolle]
MPYTPPSNRSPASSGPSSPEGSRRSSFHHPQNPQNAGARPALPRSSSYLTRQRRAPPAPQPRPSEPSPESTSEDLKSMVAASSVRQSPPPITGDRGMPSGAIMSPPDSASDDDEAPHTRGRQIDNLKQLHDAISQIPHQRARLSKNSAAADAEQTGAVGEAMHHSFSTGSLGELSVGGVHRRFSHIRSATESHISIIKSTGSSTTASDSETDEDRLNKPQMVRKKSGELVRPALRPASRRRPSSMPGTPTFSKAVHFDSHLEHVRHFLQVDRPLAVSAGSSPVDNYESDTEYPFGVDERPSARSPPFEWEIIMTNFPIETPVRKSQPVRLERVWLSNDQKSLIGSIAVSNLAFHKLVACRFTLDYWKTTSEIAAEYVCEIRPVDTPHGQDRFHFTIKLSDLANLETKTLYFCIRYTVNGQEHWDSNNGTNFQVDFRKKMLPMNGKRGSIGAASRPANGLPKSNRRSSQSQSPKPSAHSDEFGEGAKLDFNQSLHDYLGESSVGLRLKGVRSAGDLPSDNLSKGLSAPSGQFALRYDFGDSLSRAIRSAKNDAAGKSDALYMKSTKRTPPPVKIDTENKAHLAPPGGVPAIASPSDSPSTAISSASYEEIVNKWCFYGSKPKAPPAPRPRATKGTSPFEGLVDDTASSTTASYEGSPIQLGNYYHPHGLGQQHSLHGPYANAYFSPVPVFTTMGASPVESPLEHGRAGSPAGQMAQRPAGTGNMAPLAGTLPTEYPYQRSHDRFPFFGPETYAAAAIRG